MELYVTLEEARRQLNVPEGYDDVEIAALIEVAQTQVADDLEAPLSDYVVDGILKRNIWHAVRIQLATYYNNKESVSYGACNPVPYGYTSIIRKNKKVR